VMNVNQERNGGGITTSHIACIVAGMCNTWTGRCGKLTKLSYCSLTCPCPGRLELGQDVESLRGDAKGDAECRLLEPYSVD